MTTDTDTCTSCGDSIANGVVRHQEGMRPGLCGLCNDIAMEYEMDGGCW